MYDPFAVAKRAGLLSSVNSAENMLEKIVSLPHTKEDKSRKCILLFCAQFRRLIFTLFSCHHESDWQQHLHSGETKWT